MEILNNDLHLLDTFHSKTQLLEQESDPEIILGSLVTSKCKTYKACLIYFQEAILRIKDLTKVHLGNDVFIRYELIDENKWLIYLNSVNPLISGNELYDNFKDQDNVRRLNDCIVFTIEDIDNIFIPLN